MSGLEDLSVIQFETGRLPAICHDPLDSELEASLSPEGSILVTQHPDHSANPFQRAGKAFLEEGVEHDDELGEFHVILARAAVIAKGAQEGILKGRFAKMLAEDLAGRQVGRMDGQGIEFFRCSQQAVKSIGALGEDPLDLCSQVLQVVGKTQLETREDHGRTVLLAQGELVSVDAQLPKNFRERGAAHSGRNVIGHGMEPDVVATPPEGIVTV